MSEEVESHILKRYEIIQKLGKGAYGIVWKVQDKKTKNIVALKKIFDAFQNNTDAQRTYREIMILQELDHENIVKLLNVIRADNDKDIYLVFEFMESDLHAVIRASILEEVHKQYVVYQILKCMKYMHSAELLHRDLKPSNVLINSDCTIKIADFGLARSIVALEETPGQILTEYVATRWYRSPEILLGSSFYTKGIDMWAVGCIIGELYYGKPIFPGTSTLNQVELIMEVTGRPTKEDIDSIRCPPVNMLLDSIPETKIKSLNTMMPSASDEAIDLIKNLLKFNPNKRLTAEDALLHPYLEEFHNPDDEPACNRVIRLPIDDSKKLNTRDYREKLYDDISKKKKEQRRAEISKLKQSKTIEEIKDPDEELSRYLDKSVQLQKSRADGNTQQFYARPGDFGGNEPGRRP